MVLMDTLRFCMVQNQSQAKNAKSAWLNQAFALHCQLILSIQSGTPVEKSDTFARIQGGWSPESS
jgi:hypothetical protein